MTCDVSCESDCPDENQQQDDVSPGPIDNGEVLCRGAYGKQAHYNSSGVKPAFIRDRDLLAGALSIWRLTGDSEADANEVRQILAGNAPPPNALWDIFGATAKDIRDIRPPSHPTMQVLHAYDDCSIDDYGGKHPKHGVIALCSETHPAELAKDSPLYVEIRDELFLCLKKNVVWALPAEDRK